MAGKNNSHIIGIVKQKRPRRTTDVLLSIKTDKTGITKLIYKKEVKGMVPAIISFVAGSVARKVVTSLLLFV